MATLSGKICSSATLTAPRMGLWLLDVHCERGDFVRRSVVDFVVGTDTWTGWVESHDTWTGASRVRVCGGAPTVQIQRESYSQCQLSDLVDSICRDGGQSSSLSDLPNQSVPSWSRRAGPWEGALLEVCRVYGVSFRALPNGAIWVGSPTYPVTPIDKPIKLEHDAIYNECKYAISRLQPFPNCTYNGDRVASVTYELTSETLVARCHLA